MLESRNNKFTGIFIFAGIWNLAVATMALLFTDVFFQVLEIADKSKASTLGFNIMWASVALAGVSFIVAGLNNARFRFVVAIAIPGKVLVFLGTGKAFLLGQAGMGLMFIGVGDLLFAIPFVLFLRATRQHGWI